MSALEDRLRREAAARSGAEREREVRRLRAVQRAKQRRFMAGVQRPRGAA